ncbi:3-hydroxyacyl-CoA dehydrogenase family protein [Shewanella sp. HL-SH8]|uniref:3-hydroxyacyl-CoA dehydrogenase family protein n=1 Tax=Shewanella sp. HL-SH8 TaxID=3436242 RepID=UPI003EB6D2D6
MFKHILIIGSGTMGVGVASLLAVFGNNLTIFVRDESKKNIVLQKLEDTLKRTIRRQKLTTSLEDILKNINIVNSIPNGTFFDFVFEAISEDINKKKLIIESFSEYVTENTIWATNTSSLSVTDMSSKYKFPENFIGLHFFNPVANMELIEIIPSMLTAEKTIKSCWDFSITINKHPVRVEDSPGFIVNRLLIPMINEAIGLLETRVASVDEIDSAMKLGAHHPLGPLALADMIGNDVCLSIMEALYSATGDSKYRPSYLLKKMVSANKLGRKTSVGFHLY